MKYECVNDPPCANVTEMRERHGSPFMFQRAARQAADDGYCTDEEAETAANAYRVAWERGTCAKPPSGGENTGQRICPACHQWGYADHPDGGCLGCPR